MRRKPSRFLAAHGAVSRRRRWVWIDLTRYVAGNLYDEWEQKIAGLEDATLTVSLVQGYLEAE